MPDLQDLISRLESAEGNLLSTDAAGYANVLSPWETETPEWHLFVRAASGSVDAALALVEEVLPGVWYIIGKGKTKATEPLYGAQLLFGEDEVLGESEHPNTLSIAILTALLKALQHDH